MESKIMMSFIRTNVKNMLFAVKVINSHVLMKYLLGLLNRIVYKFIISIIEQSKCFSDVMEKSF